MQRHIISVSSITYAIKGRDFLRKKGIRAYVERKTNENGNVGCGYVIVATGNLKSIVADLRSIGIKIVEANTVA